MSHVADEPALRRVVVIGTSGAGKTTYARGLAAALGVRHIELDAIHWKPNWVPRDPADFRDRVAAEAAAERWVADGNYSVVRDVLWRRATDVVWLDYPFAVIWWRVMARTLERAWTREVLFSENRESFRQSFLSRDSVLLWVLQTYRRNRFRYSALSAADEWKHIRFHAFRSPTSASAFLSGCR